MRIRPTVIDVLVVVVIASILCSISWNQHDHIRLPVKEEELYGYWLSIRDDDSAYRLLLTNGSSGLLGERDIHTNLWRVLSWQVTNGNLSIDLASVNHPEWSNEYIRGTVLFGVIRGVRGGINQDGGRYKNEVTFYREEKLRRTLDAATAIMTNAAQFNNPVGSPPAPN